MTSDKEKILAKRIRKSILTLSYKAHVGHIGSAFSIVEMLIALYFQIMKKGDKFILSKGHAAPALYVTLHERGLLPEKDLLTYCQNGSIIEEHPNHIVPGVEVSTGSLGHGLSIGIGMAIAAKVKKTSTNVFVITSDAECDEGETWEGALSAGHHALNNLCVLLDYNKVQAFGTKKDVLNIEPLADKWRAFGWNVYEADGHDVSAMVSVWEKRELNNKPNIIICNTVRGKGVEFMHHLIDWHYLNPTEEQFNIAIKELS